MKLLFTLLCLTAFSALGQNIPKVHLNHVYLIIDSANLSAIKNSDFIKNEFAALSTRTTKADNGRAWTGSYLFGVDSYLEILQPSDELIFGNAGLALSVDSIGAISDADAILKKHYKTETTTTQKKFNDKMVPWYSAIKIPDTAFFKKSHLYFWLMEYKPEFFDYNHWAHDGKLLTRIAYLKQYDRDRQNKILKRFTGATFKLTKEENMFLTNYLLICGCRRTGGNSFLSPDNFSLRLLKRDKNTRYTLASVEFEANSKDKQMHVISEHVKIVLNRGKGRIDFK